MLKKNGYLSNVVYFCMEYGIWSDFKIYSGGLGILAGDTVKTAVNLPMTFIGILWKKGYNRQVIDKNGRIHDDANITQNSWKGFVQNTGKTVKVTIMGKEVLLKIWKEKQHDLYLLDADLPQNGEFREITCKLYGHKQNSENAERERIAQEIILGIGGIHALQALNIEPDVYHFNEGHPVFALFELIRQKMHEGISFEDAWNSVRKQVVFTTHTPVAAGNETYDINLLISMGANCSLSYEQMAQIGGNPFSMTVAGLKCRIANAVSELHEKTANDMWKWIEGRTPIIPITNGVHRETWQNPDIRKMYKFGLPEDLLAVHLECKRRLIKEIDRKNGVRLSEDSIIIGFARRAAEYKRWRLIFSNLEKLEKLIEQYNIQLVFSGLSHIRDFAGKDSISFVWRMSQKYPKNVVFLEGYNIALSKLMTSGCDVWLNNPRRPLEACGTSGMKAAMNGVLNLSTLDGWWDEAFNGINGWAIGDRFIGYGQDEKDVLSLYEVLEKEVMPSYNDKKKWVKMMQESIKTALEKFSSERMMEEYFKKMYQ